MPTTVSLAYRHNPLWCHADKSDEIRQFFKNCPTNDYTAEVTTFSHPFGTHVVVSSFDGENITSFMVSGGHGANACVVNQRCDSPIEVLYNGKDVDAALAAFLASFPHAEVVRALRAVKTEFMG